MRPWPRWRERRLRAAAIAAFALALALGSVGGAAAAAPFSGVGYDGSSAGGRYTVDLTPACSDPTMGSYCWDTTTRAYASPSYVSVQLYTHHRAGSQCASKGYAFDAASIGADGAFSTQAYFSNGSPQLSFTVSGRFVSAGTVHGTVVGNYGCGTSSFTITLHPAPLIPAAPCQMLAEAHAVKTIVGNVAAEPDISSDSFSPQGGECAVLLGRDMTAMRFIVAPTAGGLSSNPSSTSGQTFQHRKPLSGLGQGAALYYNLGKIVHGAFAASTSDVSVFEVDFRFRHVWASINVPNYGNACGCWPPAAFAAQERHVIAAAKALRPLFG